MNQLEIWESTIPGRVSVAITNSRGRPQQQSVIGRGSRIRISAEDRELAEEGIRHAQNNPFRNGMLYHVNGEETSADALSDADLKTVFEVSGPEFEATVAELGEVNIRRLRDLTGPVDASRSQVEFLEKLIEERFPVGGDTPTYREMQPKS